MNMKYWEWEEQPFRDKLKTPSIKEIAKVFFENETQAYRFASALLLVKQKSNLRLRDCPTSVPISTWKRYLDFAVRVGILKHEDEVYSFTDRFSRPVRNFTEYVREWVEKGNPDEDLSLTFALARREKQSKRGGRAVKLKEGERP